MTERTQRAYTRLRQRAADAWHNVEELEARLAAARKLSEQMDREVQHLAKDAWSRRVSLKVQPLQTRKLGTLVTIHGHKGTSRKAKLPVALVTCELCNEEFEAGTTHCPECSHLVALSGAEREVLERLELVPPSRRPTPAEVARG